MAAPWTLDWTLEPVRTIDRWRETISATVVLAVFVPLVMSARGNAGSHATSLMIRVLALEEVHLADWLKVLLRELAMALLGIVTAGSVVGSMLPFLLRLVGFDPAVASAPLIATLVDVTGIVIYFSVAYLFLRGTIF